MCTRLQLSNNSPTILRAKVSVQVRKFAELRGEKLKSAQDFGSNLGEESASETKETCLLCLSFLPFAELTGSLFSCYIKKAHLCLP